MSIYNFFSLEELACPCCGACAMDLSFMVMIEKARYMALTPFTANSAYRCTKHNKEVGGKEDSAHLTGHAMDIKVVDGRLRGIILASLVKSDFKRIGIAPSFIHVDNDSTKNPAVWLY